MLSSNKTISTTSELVEYLKDSTSIDYNDKTVNGWLVAGRKFGTLANAGKSYHFLPTSLLNFSS